MRKSTQIPVPSTSLMNQFGILTKMVMGHLDGTFQSQRRDVFSFFGAPTIIVIAKLWELILAKNEEEEEDKDGYRDGRLQIKNAEHLLWALHYMKQYPNLTVMRKTMKKNCEKNGPANKTLLKWIIFYVGELRELESTVIVWEYRKTNDWYADTLASVDNTTDCQLNQILIPNPDKPGKKMRNKSLYSFKTRGPALRYKIAISIISNDIVSINGLFCPGDWNDLQIFCQSLLHELEIGEHIEADEIFILGRHQHMLFVQHHAHC